MEMVLIADDHEVVRLGMRMLVTEALGNCTIDFVSNGDSLLKAVQKKKYDLLISDVNMPGAEGTITLEKLLLIDSALKVLVISVLPENTYGPRYLKAGAYGYLEKIASNEEIKKAVQYISHGRKFFSNDLLLSLSESYLAHKPFSNPFSNLGEKQLEVVMQLIHGKTLSDAADILGMHVSTASTHKIRSFEKLGVKNMRDLLELATTHRLL